MKVKISKNIKNDFPWFANNKGWFYLDSSATSLKPNHVIEAINFYYQNLSTNPHNTDSALGYKTFSLIEDARKKLAKLINCRREEVIFTSGATESLNLIANGISPFLHPGDEIILTYGEHTSNLLPWIEIASVRKCKLIFAGNYASIPTEKAIIDVVTNKTKVIAFANVSNLLGYELDAQFISKKARHKSANIFIVCDATQMLPHKKIDVLKADCDFLVCSGHKMLAGTGIGMAFIKQKYLDKIKPLRLGGGMNNKVSTSDFTYACAPDKFEGGTSNVAGIISWGAAIDYLNAYGWDKLMEHEIELRKYANSLFAKLKNVKVINPYAKYPIIAFNVTGLHPQDLASYLGKHSIIVRSGVSCAKLSPLITNESAVVRASFYLYNDKKDIDALVKILRNIKKENVIKNAF